MEYTTEVIFTYSCNTEEERLDLERLLNKPLLSKDTIVVSYDVLTKIRVSFKTPVPLTKIKRLVYEFYGVVGDSKIQTREFVKARQMAHYLALKYTKESLSSIGSEIGGKNHATVLYSDKVIKDQLSYNVELQREREILMNQIEVNYTEKFRNGD